MGDIVKGLNRLRIVMPNILQGTQRGWRGFGGGGVNTLKSIENKLGDNLQESERIQT